MKARITLAVLACALTWLPAPAAPDPPRLEVPFTDDVPALDELLGMRLPERLSGKFARVADFVQRVPNDGARPTYPTEVHVAYDARHLYAIFFAFDDEPQKIRANMSPRGEVFADDSVNIMIDTFNDQRRAYFFLSTPLGIQWDGQFIEGRGFDGSFEAVWEAEGRLTDGGFVVKMTIPFKSIRFPDSPEQTWRVIFNRMIPRLSEDNFWPHYSLAIEGRLNQTALMTGIRDISPGRNMQLVPFGFFRDFRSETGDLGGTTIDDGNEESVGLDAKLVVEDAFVLDLTANPDFSQVEADEPQVTVNQRFEVFFPERRPFFLENADVFQTPTNLLFTRRIADPSGGVKLTGKRGLYSVGLLFADDEAPGKRAAPGDPLAGDSAQVGVLRMTRDLSAQSKLGLLLADRELGDGHNRVGAFDGRIKLDPNWVAQFQFAAAATRQLDADDPTGGSHEELDGVSWNAQVDRSGTHWTNHTHYIYTSEGFRTDLGFLGREQRPGAQEFHNSVGYRFRPAESKLTEWGPRLFLGRVWDTDGRPLDWSANPELEWNWTGGTKLELQYEHLEETLLAGEAGLAERRSFAQNRWSIEGRSDRWTRVSFGVELEAGSGIHLRPPAGGEPELAELLSTSASVRWRPMPPLRLDLSHLRTELRHRGGSGRIFTNVVARARANWQFTKELSLRLIADLEETDPVAGETELVEEQRVTLDALVRYLWNPWKALYVGATTNRRQFQGFDEPTMTTVGLEDEGRQLFVKFSYLFQL